LRSYGKGDEASRSIHGDRYTLRSERGRLILFAPPPPRPTRGRIWFESRTSAEPIVRKIDNQPLYCLGFQVVSGPEARQWREIVLYPENEAVNSLWPGGWFKREPPNDVIPCLLRALDDPSKFVAAHLLLRARLEFWTQSIEQRPDGSALYSADGLVFEVRPVRDNMRVTDVPADEKAVVCNATVDDTQLPAIRAQWHRRLDVPVRSIPCSGLVAGLLVVPAARCAVLVGRRLRARSLRRRSLCGGCGYDLRATPERCPECGAVPQK
jgi:hypothetical protein